MKLTHQDEGVSYNLIDIHPNDLFVIQAAMRTSLQLLLDVEIKDTYYQQEKDKLIEKLKPIVKEINSVPDYKTAESIDDMIFRKILEKHW